MKPSLPVLAALIVGLSACNAERKPQDGAGAEQAQAQQPLDQPAEDVPPATAPPATPMPAPVPGTYEGYGAARFGMSAEEVKRGWDGELEGASADACYYLRPKQTDGAGWPALMFENGKFVRYDVETIADVAPGGGQVGMSVDDIKTAYAGRVEEQPHKYVEGGKNLRIKSNDGASAIVFETDAAGKVTSWRVGVPPQVDYVEGCS
ncbi:lectin [Luteimonas gilva]|uniref:Lectin n=1 Tax=Luteimonas gilva TaxID=2572684 RepID=A0A4U5JP80_9GAMM|nr:lectin [Luteimonas gilva]TKR29647.1 lectin [Luteimonas gilva]